MRRRAVLATLGTVALAGCGWSQEQESGTDEGGESGNESRGSVELAESEAGETPIDKEPEDLLLPAEALGSGWSPVEVQRTGVCNAFERSGDQWTFVLETCAAVHEDEETAIEAYESDVETSTTLMNPVPEIDADIGNEAAVFGGSDFRERSIRVRFRDTNATGMIDFTTETAVRRDQLDESAVPERGPAAVVEWTATMHGNWRS